MINFRNLFHAKPERPVEVIIRHQRAKQILRGHVNGQQRRDMTAKNRTEVLELLGSGRPDALDRLRKMGVL